MTLPALPPSPVATVISPRRRRRSWQRRWHNVTQLRLGLNAWEEKSHTRKTATAPRRRWPCW